MDYEYKEISTVVATLLMIKFAVMIMMNELSDRVVAHMYISKNEIICKPDSLNTNDKDQIAVI